MMEPQYELMVFTLFVCLGAGTFAVQGFLALLGKGRGLQAPALACSAASLAVGGAGSFLHLQHWERAFNGFGNLASGITQELIAAAAFAAALAVYFIMMRRSGDGRVPAWCGAMALAVSAALVLVMAHSYSMAARPAWDTPLLWLYYLANAALLGSLAVAALAGAAVMDGAPADAPAPHAASPADDGAAPLAVRTARVAGIASALATAAYAAFLAAASGSFAGVGSYFDPTRPTKAMADAQGVLSSVLAGEHALLFWLGAAAVGIAVPVALSFLMGRKRGPVLAAYAGAGLACALAGGMCFRAVLYVLGLSVFMFY